MVDGGEFIGLIEVARGPVAGHTPRTPIEVHAWEPYSDGYHHPVKGACATAWNDRAVRVKWRSSAGDTHELWV